MEKFVVNFLLPVLLYIDYFYAYVYIMANLYGHMFSDSVILILQVWCGLKNGNILIFRDGDGDKIKVNI